MIATDEDREVCGFLQKMEEGVRVSPAEKYFRKEGESVRELKGAEVAAVLRELQAGVPGSAVYCGVYQDAGKLVVGAVGEGKVAVSRHTCREVARRRGRRGWVGREAVLPDGARVVIARIAITGGKPEKAEDEDE